MKIIGLTGQSGAGKSTVAALFASRGVPVLDADRIYHELLETSREMQAELAGAFGPSVLTDGKIDRKKLAAAVFGKKETPALLHTLNAITHKYVMARTRELLLGYEKKGIPLIVFDAPQLFEAGADRDCDCVVSVVADRPIRLSRIMARDHLTAEAAAARVDAQHSEDFFREKCQKILENNGSITAVEAAVRALLLDFGVK